MPNPMKWFADCWDDNDFFHLYLGPFDTYTDAKHSSAQLRYDNVDLFWK